jgi:hypothetical protein
MKNKRWPLGLASSLFTILKDNNGNLTSSEKLVSTDDALTG